jgi:hypothetical protein
MSIYSPSFDAENTPQYGGLHSTYADVSTSWVGNYGQATTQYNIVVKRNDMLYKTLNILNTVLSIFGVIMIIGTFLSVCYGLVMMTQVLETVQVIQNQRLP